MTTRLRLAAQLKPRTLETFATVFDHGSVSVAAQVLNVSQPAVTRLVKTLEADLGLSLFRRTSRGVAPTPAAVLLRVRVRRILSEIRRADEDLAALADASLGVVHVGVLLAAASRLLPRAIARLQAMRPGVIVSVREGTNDQLLPALEAGELDLVVGRIPASFPSGGLTAAELYREAVLPVTRAGHPLVRRRRPATLGDALAYPWILPPPTTNLRAEVEAGFRAAGMPVPPRTVESVSLLTNRALLLETDMIGFVPATVVSADLEARILSALPFDLGLSVSPVGITSRADAEPGPAVQLFTDCLRHVAHDIT